MDTRVNRVPMADTFDGFISGAKHLVDAEELMTKESVLTVLCEECVQGICKQ